MRGLGRATPIVMLAVALAGVTCTFPTDKSTVVFVTVHTPRQLVLQGEIMTVSATLWQRTGTDSVEIKNASFHWTIDNTSFATVTDQGHGDAEVTGVKPGRVTLSVRAINFEKSQTANSALRVAKPLEIDSVRPSPVHFGELLTVYGVAADSLFLASLNGVSLIEYPFSRVRDSVTGLGQMSFWVPPPARSAPLFFLGAGVFGFAAETTHVKFVDLFEPNDTVSTKLSLDVAGPWPGTILAPVVFTNPALSFEAVTRSKSGIDWYRFTTADNNQAFTFFINYPSIADTTTRIFLVDSLLYLANGDPTKDPIEKFAGRDSADYIGSSFFRCKGFAFSPHQAPRESTTIALKTLSSHAIHILTNWTRPARYGLTVLRGYYTADPRIKADAYEENDFCTYADSGNRRISLATPFSDTLTIDNPHDIDWLRIDVPGTGPVSVHLQTKSRPFVGTAVDSSDIDLYVMAVPNPTTATGLTLVALDTSRGSANNITATLTGGSSYYVAVMDFAGVPTRYSLCMTVGVLCTPIPSVPFSSSAATQSVTPVIAPRRRGIPSTGPIVESTRATGGDLLRRRNPRQ